MTGVEEAIKKVPLFAKLSKRDVKSLASSFADRTFPAGSVITEEGSQGMGFFIINSGTATVGLSGGRTRTLNPGDYFGEIALIDEGPRTAKISADTELNCYVLTSWVFRPFVQNNPDVAWAILQTLAQLLRAALAEQEQ